MSLVVSGEQDVGSKECQCGVYRSKISQLESELVETKMHLAELFSTSLVTIFYLFRKRTKPYRG